MTAAAPDSPRPSVPSPPPPSACPHFPASPTPHSSIPSHLASADRDIRRGLHLEYLTVSYNTLEAVVALSAGTAADSIALVGFGFDSLIELAAGAALIWRLRAHGAVAEADESRAERRAHRLVGVTFLLLAAYILWQAVGALVRREAPAESLVGIALAALSLALMPSIGIAKRRVAQRIGSRALAADAMETLVCSYLSFALLLGLILNAAAGWWWADPLAGLAMLPVVLHEGWEGVHGD